MPGKYAPHIKDDVINGWANDLAGYRGRYDDLAGRSRALGDQVYVNKPLADFGRSELGKLTGGQYGQTMLAGTLRSELARGNETAKNSFRTGAAAMAQGGTGPNSAGFYQRLMAKQQSNNQANYQDNLSRALPGYVNQTADWSEAENRGLEQKSDYLNQEGGFYGAGQNALQNAAQLRQSNMVYEKKKSFWEKLGGALKIGGSIAGGFLAGGPLGAAIGGADAAGSVLGGGNQTQQGGGYQPGGMDWLGMLQQRRAQNNVQNWTQNAQQAQASAPVPLAVSNMSTTLSNPANLPTMNYTPAAWRPKDIY